MNTPFGNAITTAEHAIAMMFALARQIPTADRSTQAGKWEKNRFMGVELYGKTLGIIGCGNIGSIVADRALGLKMKVVAYDPYLTPERATSLGVEKVELDDLFTRADFITLHTPLTEATRDIVECRGFRQDEEGRAHHQLRARRADRGEGVDRRGRDRQGGGRRDRRVPHRAGEGVRAVRQPRYWWRRRISAPRPPRRRRRWRSRSPSRWRTIC